MEHSTLFSLNRNQLKYIAIVTMTLDHIGAALVNILFLDSSAIYIFLRSVGRIAFPIFGFLLVEGFFFTKNRKKYITRLFVFALIAEIPFDFGLYLTKFDPTLAFKHQNTLFTLAIGMLLMMILETYKETLPSHSPAALLLVFAFLFLAEILGTDYGMFGVFFIVSLYYRKTIFTFTNPTLSLFICFLPLIATGGREPLCIFSFLLLTRYQNVYCKGNKYFFYLYYPLHLALLACLRIYLVGINLPPL